MPLRNIHVCFYMTGMASWQCGTNGQWRGKPDLSNCISAWMEDIKEVVRKYSKFFVKLTSDK